MAHGTLITFEGIDGVGKTTLAHAVGAALAERGIEVELLREPGGVPTAEAIRGLIHDPARQIGSRAEALLFAAARAQLVEERLAPRLARGAVVLLDRFVDSSLVYQGVGRGLGVAAVAELNRFATGGLEPDLTLLLELDPARARARATDRGTAPDRLEREDEAFFARIAAAYGELAAAEPGRVRVLDASRSPAQLFDDALAAIDGLLAGA